MKRKYLALLGILLGTALIPASTSAFYTDMGEGAGAGRGDVSYYTYNYDWSTGQYVIVPCYSFGFCG